MPSIARKTAAFATAALIAYGVALPVLAQDAAPSLSAGTPIDPESNIGRPYTLETQGDWEIRCVKAPEGSVDPCSMYQLLKDDEGNEVAEVTMFYVGSDTVEAAATFTTPLETLLTAQLAFFVDGENGRRYPYSFCTKVGCFVRAGMSATEVEQLKKGVEGLVGIVPVGRPDEPVKLKLSLKGFTAAYTKVTELNIAAKDGKGPEAPAE